MEAALVVYRALLLRLDQQARQNVRVNANVAGYQPFEVLAASASQSADRPMAATHLPTPTMSTREDNGVVGFVVDDGVGGGPGDGLSCDNGAATCIEFRKQRSSRCSAMQEGLGWLPMRLTS